MNDLDYWKRRALGAEQTALNLAVKLGDAERKLSAMPQEEASVLTRITFYDEKTELRVAPNESPRFVKLRITGVPSDVSEMLVHWWRMNDPEHIRIREHACPSCGASACELCLGAALGGDEKVLRTTNGLHQKRIEASK